MTTIPTRKRQKTHTNTLRRAKSYIGLFVGIVVLFLEYFRSSLDTTTSSFSFSSSDHVAPVQSSTSSASSSSSSSLSQKAAATRTSSEGDVENDHPSSVTTVPIIPTVTSTTSTTSTTTTTTSLVRNYHEDCSSSRSQIYSRNVTNSTFKEPSTYLYPPPIPPQKDDVWNNSSASNNTHTAKESPIQEQQRQRRVTIGIQPVIGSHRCNEQHVVIAFAYGYELPQLIHFMNTLWDTNFDGDLVLGVSNTISNETKEYLLEQSIYHPGLVVYEIVLSCQKVNGLVCNTRNLLEDVVVVDDTTTPSIQPPYQYLPQKRKRRRRPQQQQQLIDQDHATNGNSTRAGTTIGTKSGTKDSRPIRRVSVVRYEYYWAWITQYSSTSQILVTDARDVYFQRNPFDVVATRLYTTDKRKEESTSDRTNYTTTPTTLITKEQRRDIETTLYMFEEPVTIAQSNANKRWIQYTYSSDVYETMKHRMVICSGVTMGGQRAMETYVRAVVDEFDRVQRKASTRYHDQCIHNFLYHTNKLIGSNGNSITNIVVHKQGEGGIVNTIGLVSRMNNNTPLRGLGLVHNTTWEILENDGRTVPAIIHMYDRDEEMKMYINQLIQEELSEWRRSKIQKSRRSV
jgi:hypothetical protein